jgi:YHS domain-containing protein
MHVGPTVERNGDHFGAAVNLAARVAEHARADELLVTDRVLQDAGGLPALEVHPLGPVQLRGVRDPVRLFVVAVTDGGAGSLVDDPVCRMRLDPELAPARLPYAGAVWFFCSLNCARQFAGDPGRFVADEQE